MKWMIASDIHGSAYYCEKLLEKYNEEKADKLILLGDILYHGPRNPLPRDYDPPKVCAMLNGMKQQLLCVRGNCDSEVDQMVLRFPILADYALLAEGEHTVFITHGHTFNEGALPMLNPGDVLLHGHTHVPKCVEHEDYIYMNPGSTSIPKEESWHGYMTLEAGEFLWKDFDGEIKMQFHF